MRGFFSKEEVQSTKIHKSKLSCFACGLYKGVESPKMEPYGNFRKKIMVIGEGPGEREDSRNKPWQGKVGRLLQRTLEGMNIDLFEDCISLNAVNCRPPDNRAPTNKEIDCCRQVKVLRAIQEYQPEVILLLGSSALKGFLGHRWKRSGGLGGISKWRGWRIPDQEVKAWVCPTFHPSYVERMEAPEVNVIWEDDLREALQCGPFIEHIEPTITILEEDLSVLDEIRTGLVCIDYEGTGLKPHAPGHRIVCAAVATNENNTYAFMMPERRSAREPFTRLLRNNNIKKIAANIKYEEQWSIEKLRTSVIGWKWDTMLDAHVLDNRDAITNLDFQTYVNFGILGYSDEVSTYLKATKEDKKKYGANAINRIDELLVKPGGKRALLTYCGLDTIYEYRLYQVQTQIMDILTEDSLPF